MTNIIVNKKDGISLTCSAILSSRGAPIPVPMITIITSGFTETFNLDEIKSIELIDDTLCPLCDERKS